MKKFSSCFRVISSARQQSLIPSFSCTLQPICFNYISFPLKQKLIPSLVLVQSYDLCTAANPSSKEHTLSVSNKAQAELNRRSMKTKSLWANILECDIRLAEKLVKENSFFHGLSPLNTKEKVNICTSYGLPIEIIQENPRFLYHTSAQELSRRLKLFHARGLLHDLLNDEVVMKRSKFGYYLECNNILFEQSFLLHCNNQDALEGCANQCEYLQFRLKCSEKIATDLVNTYPLKRGCSHLRLKEILDFLLLEAKVTKQFVLDNIRLFLNLSVTRLRSRYDIAKNSEDQINETVMLHVWKMKESKFKEKYKYMMLN